MNDPYILYEKKTTWLKQLQMPIVKIHLQKWLLAKKSPLAFLSLTYPSPTKAIHIFS